jgi:carboxypeptidase PM20D1
MQKYTLSFLVLSMLFGATVFAQEKTNLLPERFLSQLIQVPSISGNEKEVAGMLYEEASKYPFHLYWFNGADTAWNLCVSLYPLELGKPNVVFLNHLDVVPPGEAEGWTKPPFSGIIEEGKVYGRGAIDCKGLAVMQLYALMAFKDSIKTADLSHNYSILFVSGEESGGERGTQYVVSKYLELLNPVAVFGEGGSGISNPLEGITSPDLYGVSLAEKSALWLQLEVEQKSSGHGAVPPSLYANKRLIRYLTRLMDQPRQPHFDPLTLDMFKSMGKYIGGTRGFFVRHVNWMVMWPFVKKYFEEGEIFHPFAFNTFVITQLSSGQSVKNQIGNKAIAVLDCRLLPGEETEKFINKLRRLSNQKLKIKILEASPASKPSARTVYYEAFKKAIQYQNPTGTVIPYLFPASTDNNIFRVKGIPVYGCIPAVFTQEEISSVHNVDEQIRITSLYEGIKVYTRLCFTIQGIVVSE